LFVNNIRDIPTDSKTGKRTLPVRLGDRLSRFVYAWLLGIGVVMTGLGLVQTRFVPAYLLVFAAPVLLISRKVLAGAKGRELLPILRNTGFLTLFTGLAVCIGLVMS
ncbi:UbiA family prenyltransferase, partial [Gleimia europaea]|nr:UbiA family prenyltransferase [Gleimia europaea]